MFYFSAPGVCSASALERKISGLFQKWLDLPHCLCSAALYGKNNILQLPITGFAEEIMVSMIREAPENREYRNPKVVLADIHTRTDRKCSADKFLEVIE